MIHAIGVDALNPAGRPDPGALSAMGATGIRSVFFPNDLRWVTYHGACKAAGLASIVTLARESFGDRPHADVIAVLPTDCDYVVIGNEPEGEGPSSWQMTPSQFRNLIQECAPLIAARCPGAKIVAGGLVSGQPGWLEPIADDIRLFVDFLDIHPYNKTPGEAETLLDEYWERYLIPLVVYEWNRPPDQIRSFVQMLGRTVDSEAWFCWGDGMVPGFGLIDIGYSKKPEYYALEQVLTEAQAPTPPAYQYVLGFKEMADRHPDLLGAPLENEWGPWPNCSVQKSSNGLLLWGDFKDLVGPPFVVVGDKKGFISNSGQRYVWAYDHLERV